MAEEPQYALKRKYEDQPTATDIQLEVANAKQKAQEAAARLLSVTGGAPPLSFDPKRSKSDNGAPQSGFDSYDLKPQYSAGSYGGSSKKIEIPNGRVGVLIGKGGETIKYLQLQSGAKIQVTRDMDADPNSTTRMVELMGTSDAVASAEKLINEVLAECALYPARENSLIRVAEAGASAGGGTRRMAAQSGGDEFSMQIPNNKITFNVKHQLRMEDRIWIQLQSGSEFRCGGFSENRRMYYLGFELISEFASVPNWGGLPRLILALLVDIHSEPVYYTLMHAMLGLRKAHILLKGATVVYSKNKDTKKLFFIPFNTGGHWLLLAINPIREIVYYLDSLGNDWTTYPDMKVLIDTVLQAFRAQRDIQTSRRGANSITWIKVACPQQRNQIDCGYFMLRFMRDTLALGRLKIPTDYFDEFKCAFYTKDQVDEIKEEWCQFMIKLNVCS
ncbi:hypothetical protein KIW84_033954 [Lathyrus oleraceus]|uniref:Ubiquitin-like protease family profile domain-containing protein n=3 Tax=Pisum sativum TaxID=3888 RepID=A0A9D4XZZ8_PEA|nr:hypothetical protein KIW84_033954 [Pisum sativum]